MEKRYILALDQGTTSSRAILFDRAGCIVAAAQKEFTQIYPSRAGWSTMPLEIWAAQSQVGREAVAKAGADPGRLPPWASPTSGRPRWCGDRRTGQPVHNAIVWQCRRTAAICDELKAVPGMEEYIRENTGLVIDAYFSATKLKWILDNVEGPGPGLRPATSFSARWIPG